MYDNSYRYGVASALAVILLTAGAARADELSQHVALGVELGVGSVITPYSPTSRDGGGVLYTSLRGSLDVGDNLALLLALRLWSLPGANHATMPGVGLRYEPYRSDLGRAFVDLALGIAWTNDASNIGFDFGGGFELDLPMVAGLSIGPVFRYGQVVDPAPRTGDDGRAWQLGASATFHLGRAQAAAAAAQKTSPPGRVVRPYVFNVPDSDHDGVTDDADQCPAVPAGRHRDPFRPGCPENDEDGDGITDSDDVCPLTPVGDHPDPKKRGCPFSDADGDGIRDDDDHCPNNSGPASSDPMRNGCPEARKAAAGRSKSEPAEPAQMPALNAAPKRSMVRPRN